MDVFEAIRGRRTVKAFGDDPLTREQLEELFDLARWAPNHKLTQPWRFRVLGDATLAALKEAAAAQAIASAPEGADPVKIGETAAAKLDRAPTMVVVSSLRNPDPVLDGEDFSASAIAAYIVLLGAHARGLGGYWRTPAVLRDPAGLAAIGVGGDEEVLGLLHLGKARGTVEAPRRDEQTSFVEYLD
ncbi:MAG: nitroreductase family protein [Solirubrobacterales bacterium]